MNSAITPPLPVFVKPHDDESLLSLIARAAKANVFERTGQLLTLAGSPTLKPAFVPFTGIESAEGIARLLSLPTDEIKSRMHPTVLRSDMINFVDWYGTPLSRRYITANARRYGGAALVAGDFHRAISMVKPVSFCPLTGELLRSCCPDCGRPLGWANAKGNSVCDICEACLRPRAHEIAEKIGDHIRDDCIDAATLISRDARVRNLVLAKLPPPFHAWEAGDVFSAIVELGVTSDDLTPETGRELSGRMGRGDFSRFLPRHLAWGYRFLRGWPDTINENLVRNMHDDYDISFGPYVPLAKFFARSSPSTPFRNLLRSHALESEHRVGSASNAAIIQKASTGNAAEFVGRFKISKKTLRRLRGRGCSVVSEGKDADSETRYDIKKLSASIEQLRGSMQAEQCSRVLGIPAFCIPALATAGFLERITDRDALLMSKVETFRTESVVELASAIRNLPLVEGKRREVNIAKSLLRRLNPADWVDVVSLLISGEIPVLRKSECTDGALGTLLVDRDVIASVLVSLPDRDLPSSIFLSRSTAGKLLGVTGTVITHAVNAGLLRGERGQSEMKISLVDLAAFH